MKRITLIIFLTGILLSCNRNPLKINVSDINLNLTIKHLDVDLFKLNQSNAQIKIPELKKTYKEFFDIFTYRMINVGGSEQDNFQNLLLSFVTDTLIRKLETEVSEKIDTIQLRDELTMAFRHYRYYFPDKPIPVIYTCISGFNQSLVTADSTLGISLENYLGGNSKYYAELGLPLYKRRNMIPEKIVPDLMFGWVSTEWTKNDQESNLLSQMIHEGKMMYLLDALMPETADSLKIGFSKKQLDFCRKNESSMWTYLAEHKLLFTTDRMSIKRFIDDGPYTTAFTNQSPAKTGIWIGWQIVRSYMKQNPETRLQDLIANTDYQEILKQSAYQP